MARHQARKSPPAESAQEAQAARGRILKAARRIFAERGFDDASTKIIAEAAGVPSGLVFYYFGNKEALLEEIFTGDNIVRAMTNAFDAVRNIDDPYEALSRVALGLYTWLDSNKELAQIFFREITSHRPIAKRLQEMRRTAFGLASGYLDEKIAARKLAKFNTEVAAQAFGASIQLAVIVDRPADPSRYARELARLIIGSSGAGAKRR